MILCVVENSVPEDHCDDWKQEALDIGGQNLVEKLIEMATNVKRLVQNEEEHQNRMANLETQVERFHKAFPADDMEGHCRYHELIIASTEEKRKLRVAIQEKTISGLIWAAIVGVALMMWTGFLSFINQPPPPTP